MPLRDHFRPPVDLIASWEELHGAWPATIAYRLNAILPPEYRSGLKVHLGNPIEIDVGTYEMENGYTPETGSDAALAWQAETPTLLLETDELTPPEYEVRVYDERRGRRLVAVVEIVSPRNKDRPTARDEFVSKCHARLRQGVCVAIVDPVTVRSANLFAALAERLGADPPAIAAETTYAVACRFLATREGQRVEMWQHALTVGSPLPTLPLWVNESRYFPLELERTYEETCKGLRIV